MGENDVEHSTISVDFRDFHDYSLHQEHMSPQSFILLGNVSLVENDGIIN